MNEVHLKKMQAKRAARAIKKQLRIEDDIKRIALQRSREKMEQDDFERVYFNHGAYGI